MLIKPVKQKFSFYIRVHRYIGEKQTLFKSLAMQKTIAKTK